MSLFDYYRPSGRTKCPACGTLLREWQGKDGPRALFVWEQGEEHPIAQETDDQAMRWSVDDRKRFLLPPKFAIYSYDCPNHQPVDATCTCTDDVWSTTEIEGVADGHSRQK